MEELRPVASEPSYLPDFLAHAAARLADADSLAHGLRVLTSNYGLVGEDAALVISAYDSERGVVEELFASGHAAALFPAGLKRPLENTGTAYFIGRGPAVVTPAQMAADVAGGNIDFGRFMAAGVHSVVGTPIFWRLNKVGVVQLLRSGESTGSHVEFTKRLAGMLGPHIALAGESTDAEDSRVHISALAELAGLVSTGSDIGMILEKVALHARRLVGYDAVVIRLRDQWQHRVIPFHRQGVIDISLLEGKNGEVADQLAALAADQHEPFCVTISTVRAEDAEGPVLDQFLELVPSILIAPLWGSGRYLGTIECYSLNEWAYGARDIHNISQLADLLSHGVSQLNMIDAMSQQIGVRATMAELARIAAMGTNVNVVLANVAAELAKVLTFRHVTFYLPDVLISTADGLHVSIGASSFSALPYSTVENLDLHEIQTVTAHTMSDDENPHTAAVELWPKDESGGAFMAVTTMEPLVETDVALLDEAARHIAPAVSNLMLHMRDIQLIEQQQRADRAETSAQHFQDIDRAKREVLSTVMHELRTPLTSIHAFADILRRNEKGNLNLRQIQNLEVINRNAMALSNIITDLDDVSSIETRKFALSYAETDLVQMVQDVAQDIRPLMQPTDHSIHLTLPGRPVCGKVDRARLSQVLSNLINNAVKYSPPASVVRVMIRVVNRQARFYVGDRGDGIPEDQQGNLFDLFARATTPSERSVNGSGVGLYVCKNIVDAHHGQITMNSVFGEGTTLYFWVPLEPADDN